MPEESRDADDAAAELLDRWQAHHQDTPTPLERPEPPAAAPRHAARHAQPEQPGQPDPGREGELDQVTASRQVIEVVRGDTLPPSAPPEEEPPVVVEAPAPVPDPVVAVSTDVVFAPRTGVRRVLGLLVLASLLATAVAAYDVYTAFDSPGFSPAGSESRRALVVGAAALLGALTLVLWAVRAGSSPVRLAIHSGQLQVVRGSKREVVDLSSHYVRYEIQGTPGRPGWKVLFGRIDRDPLVVDSSMVDPRAFTAALERYQPRS